MTRPQPRSRIPGSSARVRRTELVRLSSTSRSQHRYLADAFSSRGVALGLPLGKGVSLRAAAVNGSSLVGWSNILGLDRVLRPLIVAAEGFGIGESDWSQIEIGIAAAFYGDAAVQGAALPMQRRGRPVGAPPSIVDPVLAPSAPGRGRVHADA